MVGQYWVARTVQLEQKVIKNMQKYIEKTKKNYSTHIHRGEKNSLTKRYRDKKIERFVDIK